MALVGQHQQTAFTNPQNGQSPIDADQVTANDNALRASYNAHDSNAALHVQTDALASRPAAAAGNSGGLFVSTDGRRAYLSNGTSWSEVDYLGLTAGGTVAGATTFSAALTAGATLAVTGAATFDGNVTLGNATSDTITVTGRFASALGFSSDNTYDIGVTGAKPRDVLVGRNLDVVGTGTFGGKLSTVASATGGAGLSLPHGAAPTSPVNGDVWTTTAGMYVRINGSTVGPLGSGGGGGSLSGSGTSGVIAKWTGTSSLGDSILTDSGTGLTVGGTMNVTGNVTLDGNTTLGNATSDTITFTGRVASGITFSSDNTYDLGASGANRPRDIFAGGIGIFGAATTAKASLRLPHGSAPTSPTDGDVWTTTSGIYVRVNGSTVGPLGSGGGGGISGSGTSGKLTKWTGSGSVGDSAVTEGGSDLTSALPLYLPAATTSVPSLRLPHGSAPTSPTNGDVWTTTSGLYVRVNGATVGPLSTGGSGAPTDATYVTLSSNGSLSGERVLTAGTGITITDGGANSTVTVSLSSTPVTGSMTSGYIPKANGSTSLTNSLIQDNGTTVSVGGSLSVTGNTTLGDAAGDTITVTGRFASALTFSTDATYDIGASGANRPRHYYGSGDLTAGGNASVGGTLGVTGKLTTAASGTSAAGLNLPHGSAPTSPTNGDVWTTTAGLYARINGATVGPFGAGGVSGSGTSGTVPRFTGTGSVGDSAITDDGGTNTKLTATNNFIRKSSTDYDIASVTISTSDASGTPPKGHIWLKY